MKRIQKSLLPVILILWSGVMTGQNQLDDQGRKTGRWKVEYPDGKLLYEASFLEGRPVGLMIRYHENGSVRARMMFDSIEDKSYTTMMYESGLPAAEGWYLNKAKDSVWTYYSNYDETVRLREPFCKGMLHGVAKSFYPNGQVSEEVRWEKDKKEGFWKQYYEDGSPRLDGSHKNNMLSGNYRVYFSDSTLKISGTFLDDVSHGIWTYYDEEGEEIYSLEFNHGQPVDDEIYKEMMQDSLRFNNVNTEPLPLDIFE